MDLAVFLLGTANGATLRAVPHGLEVRETTASEALEVARSLSVTRLLIVEPEARMPAQTFLAAAQIDTGGGLVGGCALADGMLHFGSVFSSVPFGPYAMESFPLVDVTGGAQRERPSPESIDTVTTGAYLVDRLAFIEVGGLDPNLGTPWRAYDLSLRFRNAGKRVRWDGALAYVLDGGLARSGEAVDHRDFMRRWGSKLTSSFDLEMPARGGLRRPLRLPFGQREAVAMPMPQVDAIVFGVGNLTPNQIRISSRVRLGTVRDARGEQGRGIAALRDALASRGDRYILLVDARAELSDRWVERMLVGSEWATNVCAVSEPGRTLLSLSRIPLDIQPPADAMSVDAALDVMFDQLQRRARIVRGRPRTPAGASSGRTPVSVVVVAQSEESFGRTSFEGIYTGDLGVDYHAVTTPARTGMLEFLKGYPTIRRIVDDSRNLAAGVNAALSRAEGEIVVVIGDDFFPPRGWIEMVREAFSVRPESGIVGFSTVMVDGSQCVDAGYNDIKAFHTYAGQRRATMRREAHLANRLAALAIAIDARALAAVGGFDERLGAGRWGIEDLTIRIRSAGYECYVSEDLFAHHFPIPDAKPFLAEPTEEGRRAAVFAEKWGLQPSDLGAFNPAPLVARGFDPNRDFVPLVDVRESDKRLRERYDAVFVAACPQSDAVDAVAPILRRYFQAFNSGDDVLFAIGVGEGIDVESVSARARALVRKAGVKLEEAPDVVISPLGVDAEHWVAGLSSGPRHCVHDGGVLTSLSHLDDLSPSGLRRAVSVPA
jgi:GT2 family glycosyltransferase